ncbi:hypothetical protein SCHPADRAFT_939628 [Schizopora paradoxa]|uniref:DUF6533 domain-containing protein n=1 Tax=Schizopora paradoxa TaxID=27342 RepID=A0A0H2SBR1_9AGAM|nr:hypothetical protein SCHPADRAFT_939628 [Schizopora paradoxa]
MEARSLAQRREPFVLAATEGIFALQCYTLASITFLYYDHIITFPQEFRKVWRQRLSFLNILFLINRYTTSLGYIPIIYFTFRSTNTNSITGVQHVCSLPSSSFYYLADDYYEYVVRHPHNDLCAQQKWNSVIVALRCYALYNRNRWVLYGVLSLGLAVFGAFIWATTVFVGIDLNFGGIYRTCVPDINGNGPNRDVPFKVAWLLAIVFDGVVFALTIFRTYQMSRIHKIRGTYGSLANLIMRDGSIYFFVMAVSYIIHIILFVYMNTSFFADSTGNNAVLTHTISVTMMSRLILNINSYGDRHARRQSTMRPNANLNFNAGHNPTTQFTTHVTNYSSWIARTVHEFETDFDSEASTGLTFSAGSGPSNGMTTDDDYATHDENEIEMTVRRRVTHDGTSDDGAPTRDSGSGWWWTAEERNA